MHFSFLTFKFWCTSGNFNVWHAMALKEVPEEVREIKDEWENQEDKENGGLKVEGDPHTSCVDEMTCATPLSHAMWCATHECADANRTRLDRQKAKHMLMSKVEFHVLCMGVGLDLGCHVVIGVCSVSPRKRNTKCRVLPLELCSPIMHLQLDCILWSSISSVANYCTLASRNGSLEVLSLHILLSLKGIFESQGDAHTFWYVISPVSIKTTSGYIQ